MLMLLPEKTAGQKLTYFCRFMIVSYPCLTWPFWWRPLFVWIKSRGVRVVLDEPYGRIIMYRYVFRVSLGASGLGGIRSAWNQVGKRAGSIKASTFEMI